MSGFYFWVHMQFRVGKQIEGWFNNGGEWFNKRLNWFN